MEGNLLFGDRLAEARKRKGLSQHRLAEHVGVSRSAVQGWERKRFFPSLENLVDAAELLNQSIDYLVWGNEVWNGIASRVRKIPPVLRDALVMRIHEEIERAEQAAQLLPPEMRGEHLSDRDARVQKFADRNLRRAPAPSGKATPRKGKAP